MLWALSRPACESDAINIACYLPLAILPLLTPLKATKHSSTSTRFESTQPQVNDNPLPPSIPSTPRLSRPSQNTQPTHSISSQISEASSSDSTYPEPLPDQPVQLVRPDPLHHLKLEIVEENVRHLHHIQTAVAVVAVVGKFHSGKSFLLNQLMGKTEGFGIGPYVRPQTMGIWMWGKVCTCTFISM